MYPVDGWCSRGDATIAVVEKLGKVSGGGEYKRRIGRTEVNVVMSKTRARGHRSAWGTVPR